MSPSEQTASVTTFLIQNSDIEHDFEEKTEAADFETAIHYAKYGKFQKILLGVCGTIYATCAISTTTLSFVLPSTECEFNLCSADKGKLSAMPLIGMIFGCCIWGSIADSKGRRVTIMLSLLVDFLAAVLSSYASFHLFLLCRFFSGFGIIGATSIVFSYLGEFLSVKHRDTMLGRLEIFWNIGMIILPGVAWSFLSNSGPFINIKIFIPWRTFVFVCGLPSLISFIMLYFLPETPKFLISKGKYSEARTVFQKIYASNTGESMYLYPVLTLEGEYEDNNNIKFNNRMPLFYKIMQKCRGIWKLLKRLFSKPYLKYLGITCFADFGLMASYYTLIMWLPEIFDRLNEYEQKNPGSIAGVCYVSQHKDDDINSEQCAPCKLSLDDRIFLDTLIIGLGCVPTSVSLSYFMNKFGKKTVLVICLILSGVTTLSLNWVVGTTQTLVLSCVFEAFTSILEAVIFCVVVDLFPTNLRAIALAVTATSGRLGAISGNMIFGMLIDLNCFVPIYLFGFLLIASGLLCLAVPRNENYIVLH